MSSIGENMIIKSNKISTQLYYILKRYVDVATGVSNKPESDDWCKVGLCGVVSVKTSPRQYEELLEALRVDFPKQHLFPFGGEHQYRRDAENGTMMLNEDRLLWAATKVKQYEGYYDK